MTNQNQKFDKLLVLVLAIAAFIGIFYTVFFIPWILNDPSSTWYRFSQNFLSYWTLLPLGVIGFGSFIIASAIHKRYDYPNREFYKLITCGTLIILVGFMFFWFYILD